MNNDPLIGKIVAGRYEVIRPIGKGGMGAIYEVRHLKLRRTFALKKLSAALAEEPEALARFQREADVVAGLRHPNIVDVVDWETLDDGAPCMVMEFLKGEDLAARIKRRGALSWPLLARLADQVLSALSVAHRAGIVHRDLKPQNIFIAQDDAGEAHAKLLDFGVSKIRHADSLMTADNRLLGTPAYMSPEQADGRVADVGAATDVWAMGAILFEMATAKQAFAAANTMAVLFRICHGQADPLVQHRPDAPPAFVSLVEAALSRDAARRLTDIERLRSGLRSALRTLAPGAFLDSVSAEFTMAGPESGGQGAISPRDLASTAGSPPTTLSLATGQRSLTGQRLAPTAAASRRRWGILSAAAGTLVVGGAVLVASLRAPTPKAAASGPAAAPASPPTAPKRATAAPPAGATHPPAIQVTVPPPKTPITVRVNRRPARSRMTLDDVERDGNSVSVPDDGAAHALRVSAPGFEDEVRMLDAHSPRTIRIALVPKRKPSQRGHREKLDSAVPNVESKEKVRPLDP